MRHCVMREPEIFHGETREVNKVLVTSLDRIDEEGNPESREFDDIYKPFTELGSKGWELVQVVRTRERNVGDLDREVTYYYFKLHTDS